MCLYVVNGKRCEAKLKIYLDGKNGHVKETDLHQHQKGGLQNSFRGQKSVKLGPKSA